MTCPSCGSGELVGWSDSTYGSYGDACLDCKLFIWSEAPEDPDGVVRSKPLDEAFFPHVYRGVPRYRAAVGWCGP